MIKKKTLLILFLLICHWLKAPAQSDSTFLPTDLEYEIESYIENLGEEVDFDFNTIFENLYAYQKQPLDLNKANKDQLESLGLLKTDQVYNLIKYRKEAGELIAIYELQAVPGFDLVTIQRILPYVTVKKGLDAINESLGSLFKKSEKNLFMRWSRVLETQRGFIQREDAPPPFFGDPNQVYLRYYQAYENKFSMGFTAEKDAGETLFNKNGFDFLSVHFFLRDINKTIKRLVIGDFSVKFGQGLILNTGYAPGKNAFTTVIKRTGPTVNRFTSVNEQNFFRGVATTLNVGNHLSLSGFISLRKRDGNLSLADTSNTDLDVQNFTSLLLSGLHRTESEINSKNTLQQFSTGLRVEYAGSKGKIAFNGLLNQFDKKLDRKIRPYNQFFFNGDQLFNASIDYTWNWNNFHFFGETAWSDNGAFSAVNGIMASFHPKIDFALHHRHLPARFQTLFGQAFMETAGNNNENGLYLGLEIKPDRAWQLAAYMDTWQHPWLRFRTDAPSKGQEYFARITFFQRKKTEAYLHWKYERKQESYKVNYSKQDELLYKAKTNVRFHLNKKVTPRLELRSRIEWSFFDIKNSHQPEGLIFYDGAFRKQVATKSKGFLAYQDIIYKPVNFPISLTTRFAIFDVGSYDTRIYAFENDVTYQFSIPAYYNKGTRFYANLKYRAKQHFTLEARYAQTYWSDQEVFGSGNSLIEGQTRSTIKVQMKWQF